MGKLRLRLLLFWHRVPDHGENVANDVPTENRCLAKNS